MASIQIKNWIGFPVSCIVFKISAQYTDIQERIGISKTHVIFYFYLRLNSK